MSEGIVNRVAQSALVQIDLEDFLPKNEIIGYDLVRNLFQGLILKEGDFREFIKTHTWSLFAEKEVTIFCSVDAIIPNWAYMLLASVITENNGRAHFGSVDDVREKLLLQNFKSSDITQFEKRKVLVKGCGSFDLSPSVYVEVTSLLQPIVSSIMFGEACSSVPVFKSRSK